MLNKTNQPTVTYILSDAAQKAYEKINELILKIFSLIKNQKEERCLKEQFFKSYLDFARKLDLEGHYNESNIYMSICEMYYDLMDRPSVLIAHKSFFIDLYDAFDELLYTKINKPNEYNEKYNEFLMYRGEMRQYYYTKVAIPSKNYNEETLNEITKFLSGGLK